MDPRYKFAAMVVLPLLLGAAMSGDTTSPRTTLSVQGTGYGGQDVEHLIVNASYKGWNRRAGTIMRENSNVLDRLRDTLGRQGVLKADFRTSSFMFREADDPDDHDGDRAKGFAVEQTLSVVVRNVARAGEVIEALVDAGAKDVSVGQGWGYAVRPGARELSAARLAAVRDARQKAEDYARALGLKIRRVILVRDQSNYSLDGPPPRAMARFDAGTVIDTPRSTLVYNVSVDFELSS